jgi:phosphate ABC transporter phosphate-binding protein
MDTLPKYLFLGLLTIVVGGVAALAFKYRHDQPPDPTITGGGSTFVYPLMVQWSSQYERSENGSRVGYRGLGSDSGIRLFSNNSVDFGCTDGPMTNEQLAKAREGGSDVLHIPLVLGAVVPVYNLRDLKQPLQFTGPVLADIYLGKIKKWNEKPIADLNSGVSLPNLDIAVVHRADGSGTTYVWGDYLSMVSPEWKEKVGTATTELKWPTGFAEKGNEGVAEKVQKTPGALGYVELTYAYQFDLGIGLVQNREKEFVRASLPAITTAAENALVDIPDDLRFSLTDPPGKGSYPIAGATWALVRSQQSGKKGHHLVNFLTWATGDGQAGVQSLLYAKLPDALVERAQKKIREIKIRD